jgi:predicted transposase YbfD/YdcC
LPEQASAKIDRIAEESRGSLTPHDIKRIAEVVTATHLMIPIIDEFDRVRDEYAVAMFTDTIKHLSDHALNTTLILVGVGDTIDDLIREHHSIERSLEQVLMPRMSPQESAEILRHGQNVTGVRFTADAESLIISLSQGLPHYTHLLGLNATRAAVDDASWRVEEGHVEAATKGAIEGSLQSLRRSFHTATSSPRAESLFKQVLLACALAATDELGYFAAADVRTPMRRITGKPYDIPSYSQHLKQFCEEERGAVLQRIGPERRTRFRFTNPLLQPFVTITGLADGLISKQDVRGLFGLQRGGGRPS